LVNNYDSDEEDESLKTTDPNAFLHDAQNDFEMEDNDSEVSASELRDKVPGDMTANE